MMNPTEVKQNRLFFEEEEEERVVHLRIIMCTSLGIYYKNPAAHIINKLPAGISSILPHEKIHEKLCRAKTLANII